MRIIRDIVKEIKPLYVAGDCANATMIASESPENNGKTLALVYEGKGDDKGRVLAEYIVYCVNTHYELIRDLEELEFSYNCLGKHDIADAIKYLLSKVKNP
jgi:hypothetical protein